MKPSELLEQKGWCQGAMARNRKGFRCGFDDPKATQFCLTGALYRADAYTHEVFFFLRSHIGESFTEWNDAAGRTKEEVIALLKRVGQ